MGKRARKRQARAMREMNALAQEQFDYYKGRQEQADIRAQAQREEFEAFEFENPYEGVQNPYEDMDNVFEDMTVDLTAAEFQAEQGAQQRANILASLRGAAGSSGVAGLAQALANQGAIQAKAISAEISKQERQNELLATQEASRIQQLERSGAFQADMLQRQGEAAVQAAEFGRESTLLAADYGLLAGAEQGLSQAMANQMSGMGMQASMYGSQSQAGASMFGSLLSAGATIGGAMIIAGSDRRLKKNIKLIGKSNSGINIYSFEYINPKHGVGKFQGVMSDDAPEVAVIPMEYGFDAVNYNMIDVEFKQI